MDATPANAFNCSVLLCKSNVHHHNGVYRMSADFDNLVETSNNIAKVIVGEGRAHENAIKTPKYVLTFLVNGMHGP
jgi:hypothetical protein